MTCFLLPRYRPRPPCCCCSVLRSLTLSQERAGSGMQPTIVLSDSPSIQFMRQDEGGRTKGRVRLFLFFFLFSLLFFSFFLSLSLSSNRHANAKETDRQTDREPQLSSPRLASVVEQACLPKTLFSFSGFGLFPFFVSPLLLLFFLSPSINQSRPRSSKQV